MSLMLAAVLVCNLNALNHTERAQLNTYLDQLSTSAANRQELSNGSHLVVSRETALEPLEGALRAAAAGITVLALGLLAARLS